MNLTVTINKASNKKKIISHMRNMALKMEIMAFLNEKKIPLLLYQRALLSM